MDESSYGVAQILSMLCEESSMRSVSRIADVSINTMSKLLVQAGEACAAFHYEHARHVKAKRVQCDEIWSFVASPSWRRAPGTRAR
jgi:hypothetical protein